MKRLSAVTKPLIRCLSLETAVALSETGRADIIYHLRIGF